MARLDRVDPNDFRYWDRVPIGIQPGEMERMRVPGMATGRTQPVVRAMVASPGVLRNAGAVYEVDTVPVPVRPPPELPVAYEVETMSTPDIDSLSRGPIEWRSILARGLLFLGLGTGVTFIVLLIENAATNVPDPKEQQKKNEVQGIAWIVLLILTAVFLISALVLSKKSSKVVPVP